VTNDIQSVVWRRLDRPGHDACRLLRVGDGWLLAGTAIYADSDGPVLLHYWSALDAGWRSRRGAVHGWRESGEVSVEVDRLADGSWAVNGVVAPGLEGCHDLDYGFTPATNLAQLRRIGLSPGETADVPVAWLDVDTATLRLVPQRYERRSATAYWYEAPSFRYAALLDIDSRGFCASYPGLWAIETR
jgi:hypothetical protein